MPPTAQEEQRDPGAKPEFDELVMARGEPDDDGAVTFHAIFVGDPGFTPAEATLTMRPETWDFIGKPDTVHVYNAD